MEDPMQMLNNYDRADSKFSFPKEAQLPMDPRTAQQAQMNSSFYSQKAQ